MRDRDLATAIKLGKLTSTGRGFDAVRCTLRSLLVTALFLVSTALVGTGHAAVQQPFPLDMDCANVHELSAKGSEIVNTILRRIDAVQSTSDMSLDHLRLMESAGGALNYCEIERRLRKLKLSTYLIAVPIENLGVDPREFALTYFYPRFSSWSKAPRYTIWYERGGLSAAQDLLKRLGNDSETNLRHLNEAGNATPASSIHPQYKTELDGAQASGPMKYVYDTLARYARTDALSNEFNSQIMYAVDAFIPAGQLYSINGKPTLSGLQIFVIKDDADDLLAGRRCNCQFIPGTNIITCDVAIMRALADWIKYGEGDPNAPEIIRTANVGMADFLLYWLMGHEIGHYVAHDNFSTSFAPDARVSNASNSARAPSQTMEERADSYALRHMPDPPGSSFYMTVNYLIEELYEKASGGLAPPKTPSVKLKVPITGHPNFLRRAFNVEHSFHGVDWLHEEIEKTLVDDASGADFGGICTLARN